MQVIVNSIRGQAARVDRAAQGPRFASGSYHRTASAIDSAPDVSNAVSTTVADCIDALTPYRGSAPAGWSIPERAIPGGGTGLLDRKGSRDALSRDAIPADGRRTKRQRSARVRFGEEERLFEHLRADWPAI